MADEPGLSIRSSPDDRDGVGVASADGEPTLDDAEVVYFVCYYYSCDHERLLNCVLFLRSRCCFPLPFIAAVIRLSLSRARGGVGGWKRAEQNSLRTLVARRWSAPWNDGCASPELFVYSLALASLPVERTSSAIHCCSSGRHSLSRSAAADASAKSEY
ncbi:hypothetical protein CDAR_615521 [Caerostris darwini]|uniref:Uncharacterized protein n=1 Tax=Caerostris darwini TaxID=1538125 RepID=A0AAV4RTE1_9ARAC|nr:hypothetical protein CDAR_615521 [Caerostris darwini]